MTREEALALLEIMHQNRDPAPPIGPEKMARLFVQVVGRSTRQRPSRR